MVLKATVEAADLLWSYDIVTDHLRYSVLWDVYDRNQKARYQVGEVVSHTLYVM